MRDIRALSRGLAQPMAWLAVIAALIFLNAWKGSQIDIQVWGWPYWLVDYGDGFMRRALAGQVFHLVFGSTMAHLGAPIVRLHRLCMIFIVMAAAVTASGPAARLKGAARLGFLAFAAWFVTAQVWPTLAYNVGYLDAPLIALAAATALLLRARQVVAAGVLVVAGPLVHEYFVFLLPFVLAAGMQDTPGRGASGKALWTLAILCVASAALVTFAADPAAAARQIAKMPVSAGERLELANLTFTQGLGESLARMRGLWAQAPLYNLANVMFFSLPSLASCAGILFWRARPSRTTLFQAAAGLFPIAALLIAWDFSRLLVLTNFTSGMLFLFVAATRTRAGPGDAASPKPAATLAAAASVAAALAYGALPFIYAYFPPDEPFMHYPDLFNGSVPAQRVKRIFGLVWGGGVPDGRALDLTCKLTSSQPDSVPQDGCARVVHAGEVLTTHAKAMANGAYRFQFELSSTGACVGRTVVEVVTAQHPLPIAKATVLAGGQIVVKADARVGDDAGAGVVMRATGLAGDGCVTLKRVSVSRLDPA
jgi:hypothetical protein